MSNAQPLIIVPLRGRKRQKPAHLKTISATDEFPQGLRQGSRRNSLTATGIRRLPVRRALTSKLCATLDLSRRLHMDGNAHAISTDDLYARLGTAAAPLLIDVRRREAFDADKSLIIGAARRLPDDVSKWRNAWPAGKPIVAYCVHGHEVSQGVASTLRGAGMAASYLEGGIAAWNARKLPARRRRDASENKWVTREHPKIDRIACPWLISRFVNPDAEFIYVPASDVAKTATDVGGPPYDIKGVQVGHVGDQCSFDAIILDYEIADPALDHLATIVRGADTSRPDLTPQCEGLLAISYGLSSNFRDDHEMLKHGMVIYDALYTWCRLQREKQSS